MNQLFSIGKSLLKGNSKKDSGNDLFGGDGGGLFNPMAVFKQFDQNGDGKITEDDFIVGIEQLGLGVVGEVAARGVFHKLDRNRNGKLDLSEALSAVEAIKELLAGSKGGRGGGGGGGGQPSGYDDEEPAAHEDDEDEPHHEGEHGEDDEQEHGEDEEHHEDE